MPEPGRWAAVRASVAPSREYEGKSGNEADATIRVQGGLPPGQFLVLTRKYKVPTFLIKLPLPLLLRA
jgi:hypothetical protein